MSVGYRAVLWNRQKRVYDLCLAGAAAGYLVAFVGLTAMFRPEATFETLVIRGFGTLGLLLLHVVLCIGPLCRLDRRYLPLLYNRRHLGVTMFGCAAVHAAVAGLTYHAGGDVNPLVSLLAGNVEYAAVSQFPFQVLGLAALSILFLMAATSHDFWLANLTAPTWKALHMLVYVAYGLLLAHVALGVLQDERGGLLPAVLGAGFVVVVTLHVAAGLRERRRDVAAPEARDGDGFVRACGVDEIPDRRARVICLSGERVAVFRYDGLVSAVSNVCRHQNGPLGEGRIVDGCITCPWHGYQYLPDSGASPPPFTESVPTFAVRVAGGAVWIDPRPLPAGTRVAPARVDGCPDG